MSTADASLARAIPRIEASPEEIYDIELEHSLLEANARLAEENRSLLKSRGGIAVFNGDATTSDDQNLVAGTGVQVVQLATVNGCHLDANLVGKALRKIELDGLRLLFLENIGNLICPAEFPLGADARVVVISVTEGPWSVRKHPHMFLGAQIVVINKIDLAAAMEVSVESLAADVHRLKPDIKVIATSCKTGAGIDEVAAALQAL